MGDMIGIPTLDDAEEVPAYCAMPGAAPRGAIVVLPEIFGVNSGVRAKADAFAASGYVTIAPDMFWRVAPGKQLDPDDPEQCDEAIANMHRFDADQAVVDIAAVIRDARDRAGARKVGVVGYCLGGRMAYLAAARTDAEASVAALADARTAAFLAEHIG